MAEFTKEQLREHLDMRLTHTRKAVQENTGTGWAEFYEKEVSVLEMALTALTAEPEAYVVGSYSLVHYQNPKLDEYIKNATPLYRLPLLEGLK